MKEFGSHNCWGTIDFATTALHQDAVTFLAVRIKAAFQEFNWSEFTGILLETNSDCLSGVKFFELLAVGGMNCHGVFESVRTDYDVWQTHPICGGCMCFGRRNLCTSDNVDVVNSGPDDFRNAALRYQC